MTQSSGIGLFSTATSSLTLKSSEMRFVFRRPDWLQLTGTQLVKLASNKYKDATSTPYLAWPDARLRAQLRSYGIDDTKYSSRPSLLHEVRIHYVQTQNKAESILSSIRETISSGVEFAEEKLAQVLDLLTASKLTAEEKYEKAKSSASSVLVYAVSSISSAASVGGASATSAASVASASLM